MSSSNRQPVNILAPFRVQGQSTDDTIIPNLVVDELVFSDGSTMTTASGGSLPSDIDCGMF